MTMVEQMPKAGRKAPGTTGAKEGKRVVTLRIRLTPEEYGFAEFYGAELCNGTARDYLRMLLTQALSSRMQWEAEIKAQLKAEEEAGGPRPPAPESAYPDLDDEIPF
jgi:hypothetical protein